MIKLSYMRFRPEEVLFSPTTLCNLSCPHCDITGSGKVLPGTIAIRFLADCKRHGIDRVGFTGGEPFLALKFLCSITKKAAALGIYFDRIMTNGIWFRNAGDLGRALNKLKDAGYDGEICVSVDAFHRQNLKKVILFIRRARSVWNRNDVISIAYVAGAKDSRTRKKLKAVSKIFPDIRMHRIALSPIGKAANLKNPWDGRWFKEDHCKGPGNAFFVMPDGSVRPCCGYANERKELVIGNIKRDTVKQLINNARKNRLVFTIFGSGLSAIRKRLEKHGFRFPGKTSNHCFFCHYIMENVPQELLHKCLN